MGKNKCDFNKNFLFLTLRTTLFSSKRSFYRSFVLYKENISCFVAVKGDNKGVLIRRLNIEAIQYIWRSTIYRGNFSQINLSIYLGRNINPLYEVTFDKASYFSCII